MLPEMVLRLILAHLLTAMTALRLLARALLLALRPTLPLLLLQTLHLLQATVMTAHPLRRALPPVLRLMPLLLPPQMLHLLLLMTLHLPLLPTLRLLLATDRTARPPATARIASSPSESSPSDTETDAASTTPTDASSAPTYGEDSSVEDADGSAAAPVYGSTPSEICCRRCHSY